MKFTVQNTEGLKLAPGEQDRIWFDDVVPGFGLRVRESGNRSWIFQYKLGRRTRRLVIGAAAAIKVGRAREIAGELHAKVKLGGDPAGEKRINIERAAHTIGALVERYLDQKRSELRPGSFREIKRHLEVHSKPLHPLPADTLDRRTVADLLHRIEKDSGAVTSNRVGATLSAMFVWAVKEGLVLANPVIGANKRPERSRDRVLSDSELALIWRALGDGQYAAIVRLLMLSGQRMGEVAGLRWGEVDFARDQIVLPGERTKNGLRHEIPMSPTVRQILKAQPKTVERELVFGRGTGPFSGLSRCKDRLDKKITELNDGKPLAHWTQHDLRRSFATRLSDLGVQPHVIECLLNHVGGFRAGVAATYNRASYTNEKKQALLIWDEHIASVVAGRRSVITPMRGRA
jgi:integrase